MTWECSNHSFNAALFKLCEPINEQNLQCFHWVTHHILLKRPTPVERSPVFHQSLPTSTKQMSGHVWLEQVVNEKINKSPESCFHWFYDLGQRDITACVCVVSGLCYLHKEGSIQRLRQVIITAEKGKLLRSRQLPSQHVGFLQLHQLFPEGQKLQLTHTHTMHKQTALYHDIFNLKRIITTGFLYK